LKGKSALIAAFVLTLLGLIDSAYLTVLKVDDAVTGSGESAVCKLVSGGSCEIAFDSPLSTVGPVPVSLIAVATYIVMLFVVLLMLLGRLQTFGTAFLQIVSILALLYSLLLAIYSYSQDSWCAFCIGLYIINTGLVVAVSQLNSQKFLPSIVPNFKQLLRQRKHTAAITGSFLVVLFAGYALYSGFLSSYMEKLNILALKKANLAWAAGPFPMDSANAPNIGAEDAEITVVKFSDFQCPYCRKFWVSIEDWKQAHPNARIVFRHYPLSNQCNPLMAADFHKHACLSAFAAHCADQQHKFEAMANALFEAQGHLSKETISGIGQQIGLDLDTFDTCLKSEKTREQILSDVLLGASMGVESTPTAYVNGFRLIGGLPPAAFETFVDGIVERQKRRATVPQNALLERIQAIMKQRTPQKGRPHVSIQAYLDPKQVETPALEKTLANLSRNYSKLVTVAVVKRGAKTTHITRYPTLLINGYKSEGPIERSELHALVATIAKSQM